MDTKRIRQFRFLFKGGKPESILLEPEDVIADLEDVIIISGKRADKNRSFIHTFYRSDLSHSLLMEWDEPIVDLGPAKVKEADYERPEFRG